MTGVRLESINKAFGQVSVLKDITLDIQPGELFFLLGPSGCGKTTLLRIIAGFTEQTSGGVFFGSRNMSGVPPYKRNSGMVFQNYALWPHMTVAENVSFGLDVRGVKRADKQQMIATALELVRLPGYEERYPHQLSGGQQQRVALARALVIKPDVILLDEPLSNLDAGLRIEMRKEIHRIHTELGLTMIYVTHDQKESLSLATRMAVIDRGRLIQVDAPAEIYQNPDTVFVSRFVGETNILKGTIATRDAETVVVDTGSGRLVCPVDRAVRTFAAGEAVAVSIRPEGIGIKTGTSSPAVNSWEAAVVESTYLGEVVQIVCAAGNEKLRLTALNPAGQPPRSGDKLVLEINPAHVRILEPATA